MVWSGDAAFGRKLPEIVLVLLLVERRGDVPRTGVLTSQNTICFIVCFGFKLLRKSNTWDSHQSNQNKPILEKYFQTFPLHGEFEWRREYRWAVSSAAPTDCPRVLLPRLVISRHEQAGLVTEVIRPYYGLLGLYNHLEDQVEGGTVRWGVPVQHHTPPSSAGCCQPSCSVWLQTCCTRCTAARTTSPPGDWSPPARVCLLSSHMLSYLKVGSCESWQVKWEEIFNFWL